MPLTSKSDKWRTIVLKQMQEHGGLLSCRQISFLTGLEMMQAQIALKVLRFEGKVDYRIRALRTHNYGSRYYVRMWYLLPEKDLHAFVVEKVGVTG